MTAYNVAPAHKLKAHHVLSRLCANPWIDAQFEECVLSISTLSDQISLSNNIVRFRAAEG
jgi:hypothetical protein